MPNMRFYYQNLLVWAGPAGLLTIPDGFPLLSSFKVYPSLYFGVKIQPVKFVNSWPLATSLSGLRLQNRHISGKCGTIR